MRNTLINAIHNRAREDKNIMFLTADLGYSVIENFQKELPNQFINVGISEQNMIGIASGLALTGKKVFCYSIVPFAVMRPYEQIRVDVCYQNLDVTMIGVGGGYAYGNLGGTHHGLEDINLMKGLPNMKILSPADKIEIEASINYIFNNKGPLYIRLNRGGEENVHKGKLNNINIESGINIKDGNDVLLITTGNITQTVINTADILEKEGISTKVISIPLIKPINKEYLLSIFKGKKGLFTIEEHNIIGGLGDSIASIIAENNFNVKFKKFGIEDIFYELLGNQEYMRKQAGLDEKLISNKIIETLNN